MQTSVEAQTVLALAHETNVILPASNEQIVIRDTRLRNWQLSVAGALTYANPLKCKLNADGELVRIRTLNGVGYSFSGELEITYATPGDTMVWSANTVSIPALAGGGVDLWVDGNTIDAFWVDDNAVAIKTCQSVDGGHTWGAVSTIANVGTQVEGVLAQLCAPAADTLVYSSSTVGLSDENVTLTALYLVVRSGGTWDDPVLWDLGGQGLGIEQRVELPNGDLYPSNLSGVELSTGKIELAYFGNNFRETFEDGIWVQRVANIEYGSAYVEPIQHLHWSHPEPVFLTVGLDDDNEDSEFFEAFPNLQIVGDEYWIVVLECSSYAGHQRYHLGWHRSIDGIHWQDRMYNQGAANDEQEFAYCYDGDEPFLVTDLIYANLVVTPERTFIVGFDKVFYCPSTIRVGEDNPVRKLDLTPYVPNWSMSLPTAPTAGTVNYALQNLPMEWTDSDILSAHHGIEITHFAGYYDPETDDDVLVQVGKFNAESISQHVQLGQNTGTLRGVDDTSLLSTWSADTFYEWESSNELWFNRFCDTSPFVVAQGRFTTGLAGRMRSGVVDPQDNFPDNVAVFNIDSVDGGICYTRFRCDRTWEDNHMGIAFQGSSQGDGDDNKVFWAVLYNRKNSNKFSLHQTRTRSDPNKVKLYKYRPAVAESDEIVLDYSTIYWLRVGVWHSHVMAWYTTETDGVMNPNWTLVIDFTSEASPLTQVIPCRMEWWGLIGTQRTEPSGALGNLASNEGMQDLMDGSGNPIMIALRVQLGDQPSILRTINVSLTQENPDSEPMPDAMVILAEGDANNPYDLTDDDNIIYQGTPSALHFGVHDSPEWLIANAKPNPALPRLAADQYVWIVVTFNGTLTASQSYKWASGTGTGFFTRQSNDEGATWGNPDVPFVAMTASIEVEYLFGRVKFYNVYFGSGEKSYTYENLAHHIAAKAGVLDIRPDDFVNTDDLVEGADGILWQPEVFGQLDDFVLDADVETDDRVEVYCGADQVDGGPDNGFTIRIDNSTQRVVFFYLGENITRTESLAYIPLSYHLQIVKRNQMLYVYINECLASFIYDERLLNTGYIGVSGSPIYPSINWTNLRVPDLTQMVDRWEIRTGQSAMQALTQLCAKPAPGTTARARFFIDYQGKLRIGSFLRQTVVDTYQDTIFSGDKQQTTSGLVSQIQPVGNYYATRWQPRLLNTDGRWHKIVDTTDAFHDEAAYRAALQEFKNVMEKQLGHSVPHIAVWPAEREDVNQLINPLNQTSGLVIMDSVQYTFDESKGQSVQSVQYRTYEGEVLDA